jgi:hypothetical protein
MPQFTKFNTDAFPEPGKNSVNSPLIRAQNFGMFVFGFYHSNALWLLKLGNLISM